MNNPIAVIGLGNSLMQDEGAGVHLLHELRRRYGDHPRIGFYDGGTKGLSLLPYMESCRRLLLIDAVEADAPGGSVHEFNRQQLLSGRIPVKLSVHDIALSDLLALLALRRGHSMADLRLIGVVPESLQLSTELSPTVRAALPEMRRRAEKLLNQWLEDLSSPTEEETACA
ncbi:MAG TPA: hydrogenase maturation protease [Acidobacteriota bacterium]|nr:hydrogenase maturation protease [Acidobacteriota bacterium]